MLVNNVVSQPIVLFLGVNMGFKKKWFTDTGSWLYICHR